MKFIHQKDLPQPADCFFRVRLLTPERSQRRGRFRFNQNVLQLSVHETIDVTEPVSAELAGSARSVRSIDEGAG